MSREIHIVALGARTPAGLSAATSAAAIRAGLVRITEHPTLLDRGGEPVRGCFDRHLDPGLRGAERFVALARTAVQELAATLCARGPVDRTIPLWLALPESRPGWTSGDAQIVARGLARESVPGVEGFDVRVAGRGHAGALHALGAACQQLGAGDEEICVVGGIDSYFDGPVLGWLDKSRRLAGSARGGFYPGEGAAFVAVVTTSVVRALGLRSLASIRGWHSGTERRRIGTDDDNLGEGLSAAVIGAAEPLRRAGARIDDVYCDINGERYRSEEWAFAMLRAHALLVDGTRYVSAADCCGDLGAASGAVGCIMAVRAWARDYARGSLALAWGGSEGGLRSAVVLQRPTG